jgi:hypothetical protein
LTNSNFDDVIRENNHILVEFCKHFVLIEQKNIFCC